MKIIVDISQVAYPGTGVARFTRGLVETILEHDTKRHEFVFFFSSLRRMLDADLKKKFEGKNYHLIRYNIPPRALSLLWNDIHKVKIERLVGDFDWVITSDWTEPPSSFKKATVVHDLTYLRYPKTVEPTILHTQAKRMKWVKKESSIIFADSESTKEDLIEYLEIDPKKIYVNYPGVSIPEVSKETIASTLEKYNLNKPFILAVGKIEPRKNLSRLIEAFSNLASQHELIIVGPAGWDSARGETKNVRFLGYVTDSELSALYSSCLFFVYPSIWEGFGYPVIEAMSLGAPVATSSTSSLGEVAHEVAILFDPHDVAEIQKALQQLSSDQALRTHLAKKGKKRASEFTWEKYYHKLIKALEQHS